MSENLEAKVKSIADKLIASRKKHTGEKKSSTHTTKKISRSLEDSLRGKDDALANASPQQKAILDRTMMETFEFIGDPTKEVGDYQKILLEQLERINAVRDKEADPVAKEAITKIIEKQIQSSKELKMPDLGIGKLIGGIFFNEKFSEDLDKMSKGFEKLIQGGGLFGGTKRKMEQATLRGQAAKEMKDIGLKDPFHTHEHDDERYYRHRGEDRGQGGYGSPRPSNPSGGSPSPSPASPSGSGGDSSAASLGSAQAIQQTAPTPKHETDGFQSSYRMGGNEQSVSDVEPKKKHDDIIDVEAKLKEVKIDKLNVDQLIAKSMSFPEKKKDQKAIGANKKQDVTDAIIKKAIGAKQAALPAPKTKELLGANKKQDVTEAIIKKEIPNTPIEKLEKMKDNEGDKEDAKPAESEGSSYVLSKFSDDALLAGGKKALGSAGNLAKGAAGYALPAAAMVAAGAGVDAVAGKLGVGGNEINEKQDDANWGRMSFTQKIESGLARGTEKVGSALFLDNFSNEAKAKRIKNETEYLDKTNGVGVSLSNGKTAEPVADRVEQSADKRMEESSTQAPVIVNNTTNNMGSGGGEKKTDIPPSPAASRPVESTFNHWQRNVFLK